jgi:hypothetical protein
LSGTIDDTVRELLAQSLIAWGLPGGVRCGDDRVITVSCQAAEIRIEPAPPALPFRWMVTVEGRKRGAISLIAVLRQVRCALDPSYAMNRVRIAALPHEPQREPP